MKRSFWSKLLFALTFLGVLLTIAGWLERVSLTDTPVTADGLEELFRTRPDLQVIAGHLVGSMDLQSLQDVSHDRVV